MPSPDELANRALSALRAHEKDRSPAPGGPPRWERLEHLGSGGMATVWRARDRLLEREVALKVLRPEVAAHPLGKERFLREARIMAGLEHEHLLRFHELVEDEREGTCLVVELVRGTTLEALMRARRIPIRESVMLLEKVARGVACAHAGGVVHRDLKPANVLVTATGAPKVGDFGVACLIGGETRLTRTGTLVGTVESMAPEQLLGRAELIGPPTDVYALGAILYRLLTGKPPLFDPGQPLPLVELSRRIAHTPPVPPSRLVPEVPAALDAIALRALAKEPADRQRDAASFAADLDAWLRGEAPAPAPRPRRSRSGAARWLLAGLALVPAVLLLVLVLGGPGRPSPGGGELPADPAAAAPLRRGREALAGFESARRELIRARSRAERLRGDPAADAQRIEAELRAAAAAFELARSRAAGELGAALALGAREARPDLVALHRAALEEKEKHGDAAGAAAERALLLELDPAQAAALDAPGRVQLESDPPGARVDVRRYTPDPEGALVEAVVPGGAPAGVTPLSLELPPGSYLAVFSRDGAVLSYPLVVTRGENAPVRVRIYRPDQVEEGFLVVSGGGRAKDVLIARREVTLGEWMQFLGALRERYGSAAAQDRTPTLGNAVPPQLPRVPMWTWPADPNAGPGWPAGFRAEWPVFGISWWDADAYCTWLSERRRGERNDPSITYRLPTSEEWLRAAAGADRRAWPWGERFAWSRVAGARSGEPLPRRWPLLPAGTTAGDSSPWGIMDLAGSVSEWTADWLDEARQLRIHRGGSWSDADPARFRSDAWGAADPNWASPAVGFRLAKEPPR